MCPEADLVVAAAAFFGAGERLPFAVFGALFAEVVFVFEVVALAVFVFGDWLEAVALDLFVVVMRLLLNLYR